MTISYLLAPIPKWYIADLTGKPLGGGFMKTYHANNKTVVKPVFQDPSGINLWPFPILFDENGSQGPFYWQVDSNNLSDTYYIEVYDASGVLQWTIDNYFPPGSGGGGTVTTALSIQDLVINNVFLHHNEDSTNPIAATSYYLAPGAHSGLTATTSRCGPDIYFYKSNTTATDQLRFIDFTLNSTPFTGDVTPETYLNYRCSVAGSSEVDKFVQFPITHGVQNLVNQDAVLTIWARCNGVTGQQILLQWCQFMGDGVGANPSIPIINPIQTLTLTTSWAKYSVSANIPSLPVGAAIGPCHNDGLFLRIQYPLSATADIDFVKPSVFLGTVSPAETFLTNDQIESTINTPRTGDIRECIFIGKQLGYVPLNNGTIGDVSSGASTLASNNTFPLFNLLYSNITDEFAPVSGGRTGSAINDYTAHKTIGLVRSLGNVLSGGNPLSTTQSVTSVVTDALNVASAANLPTKTPVRVSSTGTMPTGISNNITYYVIYISSTQIKLALSPDYAESGTNISITSGTGTGTITVVPALGTQFGEGYHQLTEAELASHHHLDFGGGDIGTDHPSFKAASNNLSQVTSNTGGDQPHNTFQPTTVMNRFIKL